VYTMMRGQKNIKITYICSNIRIKVSPFEIQTPKPWEVIGYSITAQLPMLLPSSSLPPLSSHCPFNPATKIQRALNSYLTTMLRMKCLPTCVRYYKGNRRFGWPINGLDVILWSLYFKMMKIYNNGSVYPHI